MTDLLIRPEDSGEIPAVDPGPDTRNLMPYVEGLPPAARRPTVPLLADCEATLDGELVPSGRGGCRRIDTSDEDEFGPQVPPPPKPLPPLPAPSPQDGRPLSAADEDAWRESWRPEPGRHRRRSRWGWLTVPLAMLVQRIGGDR